MGYWVEKSIWKELENFLQVMTFVEWLLETWQLCSSSGKMCSRFKSVCSFKHFSPEIWFSCSFKSALQALDYMEDHLAPGSHVVLVGLIDAGFLYQVLSIHKWFSTRKTDWNRIFIYIIRFISSQVDTNNELLAGDGWALPPNWWAEAICKSP